MAAEEDKNPEGRGGRAVTLRQSTRIATVSTPSSMSTIIDAAQSSVEVATELSQAPSLVSPLPAIPAPPPPPPSLPPPRSYATSSTQRSRSSSPTKRGSITKRDDLAFLDPSVEFVSRTEAREDGIRVPASLEELWQTYEENRSAELWANGLVGDDEQVFCRKILQSVVKQAEECRKCAAPEPQWIAKVIQPMLNLLEQLDEFASPSKPLANDRLGVFDIRTVEISPPNLVPRAGKSDLFKDLDKKIDLALGLHLHRQTLPYLRNASTATKSINQTTTFVNYNPLFLSIEVKRSYAGSDPVVQLAAWAAADFLKRELEGWAMDMPVLALDIEGDQWHLNVVAARLDDERNLAGLYFIGPVLLGSTLGRDSVCKLFGNLCQLVRWARAEYLPWFEREILGVCKETDGELVGG